jgi:hypothetical protein
MTIFNSDANAVTIDQLVGEGKKYSTVDDLAKAYLNADSFINQLKDETSNLRAELSTRLSVEEALRQNQAQPVQSPPVTTKAEESVAEQDLGARIREEMDRERSQAQATGNLAEVVNKLTELFGTEEKANEVVKTKARELGVSVEFLQDVASKSPKAFYAQLGLNASQAAPAAATHSDVNPVALGANTAGPKDGTWAFYEAIRKNDPKRYFSPTIQNKMFNDRSKLGSAFYG